MNMVCKISRLATKFKNICIELLQRITPTTDEIKLFREYAASKKDPEKLTEEDRYILYVQEVLFNFLSASFL